MTGGSGQYGRVIGYMEPLPEDAPEKVVFAKEIIGNAIPPQFIPSCEKGFLQACNSGTLIGHPVEVGAQSISPAYNITLCRPATLARWSGTWLMWAPGGSCLGAGAGFPGCAGLHVAGAAVHWQGSDVSCE